MNIATFVSRPASQAQLRWTRFAAPQAFFPLCGRLYVSLGEPLDEKTWTVRIYYKPFIDWIWGGAFIMAIGGMLAATDRRYRLGRAQIPSRAATTVSPAAAGDERSWSEQPRETAPVAHR